MPSQSTNLRVLQKDWVIRLMKMSKRSQSFARYSS